MNGLKDIFICHASEDKQTIVKSLINTLDKESISYWYDEAEIKWGDSIPQKINEGLRTSRFVIVVLSNAFISKNWPQRELNSSLNIEASTGQKRILPLIVGDKEERDRIFQHYPILNDKRYIIWDNDTQKIIQELKRCLHMQDGKAIGKNNLDGLKSDLTIPVPKIAREFSQLDKDRFLKKVFIDIKQYFKKGLNKLKSQYSEIEFDIDEIEKFKFVCTVYRKGDLFNKCKIWIGSPISNNGIAYSEGDFGYGEDSSFNEWFTVEDDGYNLGLRLFGLSVHCMEFDKDKILSSEEAAKCLWMRFINFFNSMR